MKRSTIGLLVLFLPLALFAQQSGAISFAIRDAQETANTTFTQDQKGKKEPPPDYVQYDQPPEVINQFQPDYPNEALSKKLEGNVWLKLWIGETGAVVKAKVMKSDAEVFNKSAIEAGMRWTFKPAVMNGKPVAVWVSVPFKFKLYDGKEAPPAGVGVKPPDARPGVKILREERPPADYVPYEKAPEAIKQMPAKYPEAAKKDSVEGTVWLKTLVDEHGKVTKVEIQKSDAEVLNQAAVDAVKQWVFKPAVMKGKPVAVWVSIPFRFRFASDQEKSPKK
jgi:TonB family protein